MSKKQVTISILIIIVIGACAGIFLKIDRDKRVNAEADILATKIIDITTSGHIQKSDIPIVNELLEKISDPKYQETEGMSKAYSSTYILAQNLLTLMRKEFDKTNPDYLKIENVYEILRALNGGGINSKNADALMEFKAREKYLVIYNELLKKKPNEKVVNDNYSILVNYFRYSDYKSQAERIIINPEIAKNEYEQVKAKEREEYNKNFGPIGSLKIGDPVSYVYRLSGYYTEEVSELSGMVIKHFFGNSNTKYKYITATNGYVDYLSY